MKNLLIGFFIGLIVILIGLYLLFQFWGADYIRQFEALNPKTVDLYEDSVINTSGNMSFRLKDLRTGLEFKADSLFKGKVVVLNFWETWCAPCRFEMKSLNNLNTYVKDSSFVIGIISTQDEKKTRKDSMIKQFSLPYYHLLSPLPAFLSGTSIPRTYILNKKGQLLVNEMGASVWDDSAVVHYIDSLKVADGNN